jgi:hypothetical protein
MAQAGIIQIYLFFQVKHFDGCFAGDSKADAAISV